MKIYSVLNGFVPDSLCIKINMALLQDIFKIVSPSGAPISPELLRQQALAVDDYSCVLAVLYLRETRRLQDLGDNIFS